MLYMLMNVSMVLSILIVAKSVIGGVKTVYNDPRSRNLDVQQSAINNIYACLKPGGYFLSAENMTGNYLLKKLRKIQIKKEAGGILIVLK